MSLTQLRLLIATGEHLFSANFWDLFIEDGLPTCNIINCSHGLFRKDNTSDIAILDLNSSQTDGISASRRILKSFPNARLIMLSLYADTCLIKQVRDAGIRGYLEDGSKIHQFVKTVTSLTVSDDHILNRNKYVIDDTEVWLSQQELQVLRLIREGCTNPEIANLLNIHYKNVKGYRKALIHKLNVRNGAELVTKEIQQKIIHTIM